MVTDLEKQRDVLSNLLLKQIIKKKTAFFFFVYTSATILVIPIVSDMLQNIHGFSLVLRRLPQQNMFNKRKAIKKKNCKHRKSRAK